MFIRAITIMLVVLLPCFSHAGNGEYPTLAEMTDSMAGQVKERYAGRRLSIIKDGIKDQNGDVPPFSGRLSAALESSMSRAGFAFKSGVLKDDDDDILLDVSYIVENNKVLVTLRPTDKRGVSRTIDGSIPRAGFSSEMFLVKMDERFGRLAQNLTSKSTITGKLKLLLQPLVNVDYIDFAGRATQMLTVAMNNQNNIQLLQKDSPVARKRSVSRALPLECGDVTYTGVDAVLLSELSVDARNITISSKIKNRNCELIAADSITIPISQANLTATNGSIAKTNLVADIESQKDGDMIRISTTHGGGLKTYYPGEIYTLTAQVKTPLYLYLYDIYPNGKKVEPLYPMDGETEILRQPGIIYEIPEESEKRNKGIEVTDGDFGLDVIKVFASNRKLPLPVFDTTQQSRSFGSSGTRGNIARPKVQSYLAARTSINPADLVDYYRGIAEKMGATLYETSIFVETRARK